MAALFSVSRDQRKVPEADCGSGSYLLRAFLLSIIDHTLRVV